jgi:hypothetical protein
MAAPIASTVGELLFQPVEGDAEAAVGVVVLGPDKPPKPSGG